MADKIVQLTDKDNNNIFPVTQKNITMTDVDPGEGSALPADNYIAVYGTNSSLLDFYPVNTCYETADSTFDPNSAWGGTWLLENSGPKRQLVCSQELFNGVITRDSAGTSNLIGSYGTRLIDGIWSNITVPNGWHREYMISCQISTSSSNTGRMALNNITTGESSTWSADTFREFKTSGYFKESDIVLETTVGYSQQGINCKVIQSGSGTSKFWQGTLHGFLVSDGSYYTWRRTA